MSAICPQWDARLDAAMKAIAARLHCDDHLTSARTLAIVALEAADAATSGCDQLLHYEAKKCEHWPPHGWLHHAPGFKQIVFAPTESGCEECKYCVRECHDKRLAI